MYSIRREECDLDLHDVYAGEPTIFTIELKHGGRFLKQPEIKYIDGGVAYVDYVDIDEFSVHELDTIMLELGYVVPPVIYYHFRLPNEGLDFGLRALGNDDDVRLLSKYVGQNKTIQVYTEHGQTRLLTYFMSPQGPRRVVIEEIEDEAIPIPPVEAPLEVSTLQADNGLALSLSVGRNGSATPQYSRQRGWKCRKGESSCSKNLFLEWLEPPTQGDCQGTGDGTGDGTGVGLGESVREDETQPDEYFVDPAHLNEVEFDNTNSVDQEMLRTIENFEPFLGNESRCGKETNSYGSADEYEYGTGSEGSEDSDYMVDEDNIIEEVEVNMQNFHMSIDTDAEYVGGGKRVIPENNFDDFGEDVEAIDNDEWDSLSDDSDNGRKRRAMLKELRKEKICSHGTVHKVAFHVGQKYKHKKELKEKIDMHSLETRRNIVFKKNDKTRLTAVCEGKSVNIGVVGGPTKSKKVKGKEVNANGVTCGWRLHASRATVDDVWLIKTYIHTHTCKHSRKIKACTATFISKQIMDQIETNPEVPIRALKEQLQKKYEVTISSDKVFRSKAAATQIVVGDYTKLYEVLRDYVLELQATNVDTTIKIEVVSEPNGSLLTRQFKRIYICLGALKQGFKAGMRDFLGLDGAFMKGPFPGQVLTAVGVDSNNGIYPLAYAIVETENTLSWKWFLECLADDLELYSNSNFTFITDRQKGLLQAIAQLFPAAEHRFCVRHMYENMRKQWKTREYKEYLWKCATATTIPEFETIMKEFSEFDKEAYEWLLKIPPHQWARSHFSGRAVSDMLLNNLCEVFNSKLIHGRDKPIITCLEYIREYLMRRICNVMRVMNKCSGPLTPTCSKILEANTTSASQYTARWNGNHKFQVQGPWHDQHVVDMSQLSCSCRKWELTGIPCKHAIAAMNEMTDNGESVGEIHTYIHKVYWLETWQKMYSFKVDPIKGRAMWPKSECPYTITPPPHHNMPGRPKKKRRQSATEKSDIQSKKVNQQSQSQAESQSQPTKLSRKFVSVKCRKCKQTCHNARTCKAQAAP